jgi:hypothetical protein
MWMGIILKSFRVNVMGWLPERRHDDNFPVSVTSLGVPTGPMDEGISYTSCAPP